MYYTTLERIRECGPCCYGWYKLLEYLGKTEADDEMLLLRTILKSNGLEDAIWALRAIDDCPEIRLFVVRCVREVQHLLKNPRDLEVLDVAELYAVGLVTEEELKDAWEKAGDVWDALHVLWDTQVSVADAAYEIIQSVMWEVADGEEERMREIQRRDFIDIFCKEEE